MFEYRRAALSIFLMLLLVFNLQIARMGGFYDLREFKQKELPEIKTISAQYPSNYESSKYLLVCSEEDKIEKDASANYRELFSLYKLKFDTVIDTDFSNCEGYNAIFLAVDDFDEIKNIDKMAAFVQNGGIIIFCLPIENSGTFYTIAPLLGIYEIGGELDRNNIVDKKGVFGEKNKMFSQAAIVKSSRNLRLSPNCDIYFETADKVPLLWKIAYGGGAFYVANGDIISQRSGRGVVNAIITETEGDFIYPVYNMMTVNIEWFPGPYLGGRLPVLEAYNVGFDDFLNKIWWPDMIEISTKYHLKYTACYVQSYTDNVKEPFEREGVSRNALLTYGTAVLKQGGEIGLQGYNYRPFALKDEFMNYGWLIPWPDIKSMSASIKAAENYFADTFPFYKMRLYVPPEGRISKTAFENIKEIYPDAAVISCEYDDSTGDKFYHSFEQLPNGIVTYPHTSNYLDSLWYVNNSMLSLGVVSHSINFHSILLRTDSSWEKSKGEFINLLTEAQKKYEGIRNMNISTAAREVERYQNMDFVTAKNSGGMTVYIKNFSPDMYFSLRTDKKIEASSDCEVTKVFGNIYLIKAKNSTFNLAWSEN